VTRPGGWVVTLMSFTVRLKGRTIATYDTEAEAEARAREIVLQDADNQPEVIDEQTGRAAAPALASTLLGSEAASSVIFTRELPSSLHKLSANRCRETVLP
jgi:hypothetical protein